MRKSFVTAQIQPDAAEEADRIGDPIVEVGIQDCNGARQEDVGEENKPGLLRTLFSFPLFLFERKIKRD
jgi:hypothetical protein